MELKLTVGDVVEYCKLNRKQLMDIRHSPKYVMYKSNDYFLIMDISVDDNIRFEDGEIINERYDETIGYYEGLEPTLNGGPHNCYDYLKENDDSHLALKELMDALCITRYSDNKKYNIIHDFVEVINSSRYGFIHCRDFSLEKCLYL